MSAKSIQDRDDAFFCRVNYLMGYTVAMIALAARKTLRSDRLRKKAKRKKVRK